MSLYRHRWAGIRQSGSPDCHARFFPGEGHLLVIDHMAEILGEFLGASPPP